MPLVGLIVEGSYDEAALSELVLKCFLAEVRVICRQCGNAFQLMKTFPGFLEDFRQVNHGLPVDKAIVIRDADQKNPDELIAKMASKINGRSYLFPLKLLVVVQELEAWLLGDEDAIFSVTGRRQPRIRDPERLADPKERLRRILSDARIAYTAEVARKIAAATRADVLATRCPSFRKFQEAVINN